VYQTLTAQALGPAIGAEVQNLDLKNGFSETMLKELEKIQVTRAGMATQPTLMQMET